MALSFSFSSLAQDESISSIERKWKENWKLNIGLTCYRTNMLLHNGDLLIGSNGMGWDDKIDSLDGVYVIDPATGKIKHHIQHQAIGDNDVNGLAINNKGTLFFGGDMQYIYAYETDSYSELWKYHVGADLESTPGLADLNGDGTEDVVFVTEGAGILALDGANGDLIWKSDIYTHRGNVSPAVFDVNKDGTKDIIAAGGSSFALNGKDGTLLWEQNQYSGMHASPLVTVKGKDVKIYTSASYGSFDVFQPDGTKINDVGFTYGLFSSPVPNGQGYAAEGISWHSDNGFLTFLCDPSEWKKVNDPIYIGPVLDTKSNLVEGKRISASAISADIDKDGLVEFLIPSEEGILYIAEPSKQTSEKWQLPAGAEASLFICDYNNDGSKTIFFAGLDGYLRSYEVGKTGKIVWPGFRGPSNNGVLIE